MEASFTEDINQLNLGDISNLNEPSTLSLFGSTCRRETWTYYAGALGKVG